MKPGRPSIYTREGLLDAALTVAQAVGYRKMTRSEIALAAGCSEGQVSHLLGTMVQLRRQVVRAAVKRQHLPVIAQALVDRDPHVMALDESVRRQAMEAML
jgi:AcrR family transcriptional regulator